MNPSHAQLDNQQQLATVFRRRAQQLAGRKRQEICRSAGVPVIVLRVADERFGLELAHVEQVFSRVELTPVPGAPPALVGVANLNGMPRSVFDLGRLLSFNASASNSRYIVLLCVGGRTFGLAVEGVDEIRRIEVEKLLAVDQAAESTAAGFSKRMTEDHVALIDSGLLLEHIGRKPEAQTPVQSAGGGAD